MATCFCISSCIEFVQRVCPKKDWTKFYPKNEYRRYPLLSWRRNYYLTRALLIRNKHTSCDQNFGNYFPVVPPGYYVAPPVAPVAAVLSPAVPVAHVASQAGDTSTSVTPAGTTAVLAPAVFVASAACCHWCHVRVRYSCWCHGRSCSCCARCFSCCHVHIRYSCWCHCSC